MNHLSKIFVALALAVVLAAGGSAYAHEDDAVSSDDSTPRKSRTVTDDGTSDDSKPSIAAQNKQAAQEKRSAKTAEAKQKACQSRKQGLENKFSRIVTNSERINSRIDEVLNKAVAYHDENSVTVENWDDLIAAANEAGNNADTAIASLKEVKPTIDCNNVSVSSDIKTFKEQAASTRDALKDYRKAVKAVLKALLTAKQEANQGSEGSDQ